MKRKLIFSYIVLFLLAIVFTAVPVVRAEAAVKGDGNLFSFDISAMNDKMQAAAVFTAEEYKGDLYFICDARLYKYTGELADAGQEPVLIVDNASSFWIENDAIFYSKSYENAVYRTDLNGENKKRLSKQKYGVCLTGFHNDGYFYLWDKNKFYRVSEADGSRTLLAKYKGSYDVYNRERSVCFYGDKFFYSYGFEDANGSYASYPGTNCDYRIYSKNTDGTGRKSVLNPKGANQEFRFFKIEGQLFAVSGNDIYRYSEKKGKFKKVKDTAFPTYMYYGEDFEGKRQYDILGSDGTYLYLYRITTEIPLELEDDDNVRVDQCINTVYIYRVGADWKPVKVFSDVNLHLGSGRILAEDDWLGLDWADENYLSILYGDEDVQTFVIDREGNFLFSMQYFINEDDYPDYFEADENGNPSYFEVDESMVRVRIFDGRAYVIECDGGGHIGAVKIIPLEEAVKNENERKAASAKRGDKIRSLDGNFLYEITSTEKEKTCSLIWWQDDFYGNADAQKNGLKYIIPETIKYGSDDYTVNEIRTAYGALDTMWVDEIEFPATIRKTNLRYCLFELDGFNPRPGVKITFKCDPSVFTELKKITVSSNAIESIIYVPEEYLEGYRELLKDKTACDFSDNDIESRVYTGIPVTYIGDEDILPEGFVNDGSFYRILDSKKRTVSLLTTYKIMGLGENSYTQPGEVMYRGEKYTVTGIEYYAFCNVHYKDRIELKLPSTVASIESRSIGWTVTKLDLSETKIKEIPEFLVNSDYDEYDEPTVITEILLPKKCKKIAEQAFYNCEGLKNITLPKGITIGTDAMPEGCVTIYY